MLACSKKYLLVAIKLSIEPLQKFAVWLKLWKTGARWHPELANKVAFVVLWKRLHIFLPKWRWGTLWNVRDRMECRKFIWIRLGQESSRGVNLSQTAEQWSHKDRYVQGGFISGGNNCEHDSMQSWRLTELSIVECVNLAYTIVGSWPKLLGPVSPVAMHEPWKIAGLEGWKAAAVTASAILNVEEPESFLLVTEGYPCVHSRTIS